MDTPPDKQLSVRLRGKPIGTLAQDPNGRLSFAYDERWTTSADATPISLSMPFEESPFDDAAVQAFFGGYLPEGRETRARIARHFGISANSTFRMLAAVGRDCAGALSLHPPDEPVDEGAGAPAYEYLDEVALAAALRELERRPLLAGPGRLRLSLAGVQSKTALYVAADGRMALPRDAPSTHIIKPELDHRFPGLILIEYFCLELARRMGLEVPAAAYGTAQGVPYLLIERYDRVRAADGSILRLHQEDFCQALRVRSDDKYESDGGPGLAHCFLEVIDRLDAPAANRLRMLDCVIFNVLVGNTDAHAKNFSILYAPDGMRLAPFYDLLSTFVFQQDDSLDLDTRLAMKIGGENEIDRLRREHWERFASQCTLAWPAVRRRLETMSREVQHAAIHLEHELAERRLADPILHRAITLILQGARRLRRHLTFPAISEDSLPERQAGSRVSQASILDDALHAEHGAEILVPLPPRYRRFMMRLAVAQRRARLAGDTETDRTLGELGRALTRAFNAWRDGPRLDDDQRDLLAQHLGPVPAPPA